MLHKNVFYNFFNNKKKFPMTIFKKFRISPKIPVGVFQKKALPMGYSQGFGTFFFLLLPFFFFLFGGKKNKVYFLLLWLTPQRRKKVNFIFFTFSFGEGSKSFALWQTKSFALCLSFFSLKKRLEYLLRKYILTFFWEKKDIFVLHKNEASFQSSSSCIQTQCGPSVPWHQECHLFCNKNTKKAAF